MWNRIINIIILSIWILTSTQCVKDNPTETPQSSLKLYINEILANNESIIADTQGEYDDWIEIYNGEDTEISLYGFYLTDDIAQPTKWTFPDTTIEAGGFILVWCDEDEGDDGLHTNFKLSASVEEVALFGNAEIDRIEFDEQTTDISYGRSPDGSDNWVEIQSPTPAASNLSPVDNNPPTISSVTHFPTSPSPNDSVIITAIVTDDFTIASVNLSFDTTGNDFDIISMLSIGSDNYSANIPATSESTLVNYFVEAVDDSGSVSRSPSGAADTTYSYTSSWEAYVSPALFINEFMADNETTVTDPQGDYDDWIEIYNSENYAVNLNGMYLTDELTNLTQWMFPDTTIEAGGFIVIWADEDTTDDGLHANFKLSKSGEQIGLFDSNLHNNLAIDTLTFDIQTSDISYGRLPDGSENWQEFTSPTPGTTNVGP